MTTTIGVPAPLSGPSTEALAARARLLLVIDEVRAGRLTRAAAAQSLDMALDDFRVDAGRHGLYASTTTSTTSRGKLDIIAAPIRQQQDHRPKDTIRLRRQGSFYQGKRAA